MQILPLDPIINQEFKTTLDGVSLNIRIFWNDNNDSWYMDLNGISEDLTFTGIRLCVNQLLLEGLAIREIGNFLLLDMENEQAEPNFDGLGTRWKLSYVTREELGLDVI